MVSIIIPTLNEEKNIEKLLTRIIKLNLKKYEIIIADSNSKDNTIIIAKNFAKKWPIKIVRCGNADLSNSVKIALNYTKYNIVAIMDADLQHPPEILPKMIKEIKKGNDIVIASRFIKNSKIKMNFIRKLISKIFIFLTHILIPKTKEIKDTSSGFFIFKKEILKNVKLNPKGFKIILEILAKGKYNKVKEIPFNFGNRKKGKSKFNLKQVFIAFKHLLILAKYQKEHKRIIKFCIVGGSGIIVNEGLLWLFTEKLGLFYLISSLIAIETSIIWNFIINDLWTFKKERTNNFLIRLLKFNFSRIVALLINFGILWVLTILGLNYLISNLIGIFVATIFTYITSLLWVWK